MIFATFFGIFLFLMNFIILFMNNSFDDTVFNIVVCLLCMIYLSLIAKTILEPTTFLKKLSKEQLEDHEYQKIIIDEEESDDDEVKSI